MQANYAPPSSPATTLTSPMDGSPRDHHRIHADAYLRNVDHTADLAEAPANDNASPIRRVGIIGANEISIGIAVGLLDIDIPVTVFDRRVALDQGLVLLRSHYENAVVNGLPADKRDRRLALFSATERFHHLKDSDLIIEVMTADTDTREKFFRWLDEIGKPEAIMVANASSSALDAIARVTRRPADVLGLQFSNPGELSEKLILVRGSDTSAEALSAVSGLLAKVGKPAT